MTEYSVLVPFVPRRPEQLLPFAGLVHWTGAHRLWQGQGMTTEPYQGFAHAAGAGFRVPTGLGVTLMPMKHPYEAALQAKSLSLMTGESVVAGFGPGSRDMQWALRGEPYRSPLTAAREYLTAVRGALTGTPEVVEGEYWHQAARLAALPGPVVELGLGVLRPGMAKVAGELADVAITWLTPARYLAELVVPALKAGAEKAGRGVPRVAAIVPLALAGDGRDPAKLALASNGAHLSLPHYRDMLRKGHVPIGEGAFDAGSPEGDALALVKGDAFLYGTGEEIVDRLAAYRAAGVDEIVLNVTGVASVEGAVAASQELKKVLRLVGRA
ncbi:LLM class flavin-dependent oxidoreductase [Streptomyces sp. NBC_00237]|uniref:LLM class flavin-dependent oxidoreductase n=1 Tax=Streptomyces sp. NBC_00237 TaxID=2975687 RepID=UPI002255EA71|nr:LLM class flavin-dependent oxidoreductase [Streptomyces sp. NBC_00237]MCX5200282.1 LLM class flavin-dependent oxidoreductase [Streptomyces sp. NBC_00237]